MWVRQCTVLKNLTAQSLSPMCSTERLSETCHLMSSTLMEQPLVVVSVRIPAILSDDCFKINVAVPN